MKELDCRGLACPQPVLNTKQALEETESGRIRVIVDNEAARDNVTRFCASQGCEVEITEEGADFILTVTKDGPCSSPEPEAACEIPSSRPAPEKMRLVVKISDQIMGKGPEPLGRMLMKAFIKTLSDATLKPQAAVFYNSGIHLAVEGSEYLEDIKALKNSGMEILVCGTCLDFFGLKEKLVVGRVSNMFEIIEILAGADRIVSP
ncbi:MAG: sulfurtransferase-like selenium metabolism protein YedF [Deltaproteobacteria bacterium]|nr:sulfurtransferase-like selenium metabolism protein YedF [Deltaproteobacteria bacterium]MBW2085448.1 sulfurtransferase-like selenium metabolism protein YedF [Deltaproteobacteria bacterium]